MEKFCIGLQSVVGLQNCEFSTDCRISHGVVTWLSASLNFTQGVTQWTKPGRVNGTNHRNSDLDKEDTMKASSMPKGKTNKNAGGVHAGTPDEAREREQTATGDRIQRQQGSKKLLKEVMTQGVETISPESPLIEAAEKMKDLDVGGIPVCENDRLIGMLTDRDITVRIVAAGRDPRAANVSEAMSSDPVYCFEDQAVEDAAKLMQERQLRRLMVLDRNHRLVGIVSLGDLATQADARVGGEILEQVSKPT
jgi:CBS domain-containing protein